MRGPKESDVMSVINDAVERGAWRLTNHARQRMQERDVVLAEVENILINGWHHQAKDKWDAENQNWKYAICGTVDDRNIRLAVAISGNVFIITVIDEDN